MASTASGFVLIQRAIKGAAIVLGGVCTFVSFSSIVGIATGNAWARAGLALVLTVVLPMAAVDRALPKKDAGKARPGLVVDVIAMVLLGVALLLAPTSSHPPKQRAQRFQGVNNIVNPFPRREFVLTNVAVSTDAYPASSK